MKFTIPIRTSNEQNGSHGHWAVKARKRDKTRDASAILTKAHFTPTPLIVVTLTRYSAGELDDDGLRAALKSVRDGIASALRIDDGSKLIRFDYGQEKCARGQGWVAVEIDTACKVAERKQETAMPAGPLCEVEPDRGKTDTK